MSEKLGSYVLEEEIGVGGMGRVFRARHGLLGRPAAIKLLNEDLARDDGYVSRFFHEAKVVNEIRHPNIIDIFDYMILEEPRRVAYVMELLEGRPLSWLVHERKVSGVQAVNAGLQLASALQAVHGVNVVHRDLKPENVFVTASPASEWSTIPSIKILDFGIAKFDRPDVGHRTQAGALVGTPSYMAPEQVYGAPVSSATDVYALGEILFEMLTGRRLFIGSNEEVFKQKVSGMNLPNAEIPGAAGHPLTSLIQRCIATEPEDRPTLADIRYTLEGVLKRGDAHRLGMTVSSAPEMPAVPGPTLLPLATPAPPVPVPVVETPRAANAPRASSSTRADRVLRGDRLTPPRPIPLPSPPPRPELRGQRSSPLKLIVGLSGASLAIGLIATQFTRAASTAVVEVDAGPSGIQAAAPTAGQRASNTLEWVMVTSHPAGSEVFEGAQLLGQTPLNVPVEPGATRRLTLRLEGYRTEDVVIDSKAREASIRLIVGETAQRPEPPKPDGGTSPSVAPTPTAPKPEPPKLVPKPPASNRVPDPAETTPQPATAFPEDLGTPPRADPSVDAGRSPKPIRKDEVTTW
ncbi:MAG: protein kinase [Deltaproteobacteria bacterium]|nr:protein kinase [Deltaproteobacteria bacterium]